MHRTQISIGAVIAAPIDKVWQHWTEPAHITRWNFASDDWHCPRAANDLRAGGNMNVRMEAKDGSFGFDFEALYDEVVPHKRIAYTMADGRRATTDFVAEGTGTLVTTTFDAETENPIEMQREGWQAILNNFKRYTERG